MTNRTQCLPREERLRGRGAVNRLFTEGSSGFAFPLRYVWRVAEGGDCGVEVLFNVPKRFHKRANKRNLLRRRVKEAYRLNKIEGLSEDINLDIALIYSTKEILDYEKIERSVQKALAQISEALQQ